MVPSPETSVVPKSSNSWFATTHWDWIAQTRNQDSPDAADACERLCKTYWSPIYRYIRRFETSRENAEDLTQGFVLMLLEKNFWGRADRNKGRFRNLLLKALTQFLLDEKDRANAIKRGRGVKMVSMQEEENLNPALELTKGNQSPEELFNRSWAFSLMEQARARLRLECQMTGKDRLSKWVDVLAEDPTNGRTYPEIAQELGLSVSAVKSGVSRLRARYAEIVREEVARTVNGRKEIQEEIQFLLSLVAP